MEITGKIIRVLALQSGQGKNGEWRKQEFILQTEGQYPKNICFSMWGNLIDQSQIEESSNVKVSFDIESREFNSRWYTEAKAWRITKVDANISSPTDNSYVDSIPEATADDSTDDLPF